VRITLTTVEAAYELLRTTPPFKGWRLPESDDVEFILTPLKDALADHCYDGITHTIRICLIRHTHLSTLLISLAHEMVHIVDRGKAAHGASFKRRAAAVCRQHGWDLGAF
jgi:hypothetical protein